MAHYLHVTKNALIKILITYLHAVHELRLENLILIALAIWANDFENCTKHVKFVLAQEDLTLAWVSL